MRGLTLGTKNGLIGAACLSSHGIPVNPKNINLHKVVPAFPLVPLRTLSKKVHLILWIYILAHVCGKSLRAIY